MFSSNQIFSLSGELNPNQIKNVLDFLKTMYDQKIKSFQITKDGGFALGWCDEKEESWTKFQFEYDSETLALIICNHLKSADNPENPWEDYDGSCYDGFRVDVIEETFANENNGVKDPFYGIVKFTKYVKFYSK